MVNALSFNPAKVATLVPKAAAARSFVFSSESVTEGHPDKIADQISDSVLDAMLDLARTKLARKGCDLLVVNDVSGGQVFGSPENEAVVLDAAGGSTAVPHGSKSALAHVVWDRVVALLDAGRRTTRAD